MDDKTQKLRQLLKNDGHSLTEPRIAVFRHMLHREPVSMAELTDGLKKKMDRASVYRTVALFQKLGIIQRHNTGWKYKVELSDMFAEHHHHLTCIRCGRIEAINEKELETFVEGLAQSYGYVATEHQIEIQGYCQDCKTHRTTGRI